MSDDDPFPIALDIYLSGWASGVKSALLNWSDAGDEEAQTAAKAAVDHLQRDPIACAQLRQVIEDIVFDTEDAPAMVTAYSGKGSPNDRPDRADRSWVSPRQQRAADLAAEYEFQHPDYAKVWWEEQVAERQTDLGYWEWVAACLLAAEDSEPPF